MRADAVVLLLGCSLTAVSCAGSGRSGPPTDRAQETATAHGELVKTGVMVYDVYFASVHELHTEYDLIKLDERSAAVGLATALELVPSAPHGLILKKIREAAATLPSSKLVIDANETGARTQVQGPGGATPGAGKLLKAIEAAATAELKVASRARGMPERAHRIRNLGATLLDSVDKDFQDPKRQAQVRRELQGSFELMRSIANESDQFHARHREFVRDLADALQR